MLILDNQTPFNTVKPNVKQSKVVLYTTEQ